MLNRGGVLDVPNVSFVDEDNSVRYLLKLDFTHNGYEYVDLGLPSGLKWATCNIGASSPEEYGLYFAWGETTGYTSKQVTSGVRKFDEASYTASAISTDLTLEQDAAHVNLGVTGVCRRKLSTKSCLTTVMVYGWMTITEQGSKVVLLHQRLTESQYSSLPPVTAAIRTWKALARSAIIGRLHGTRP